jgi:hypothetical protein
MSGSSQITVIRRDNAVTILAPSKGSYYAFYSENEPTKESARWTFSGPTEIRLRGGGEDLSVKGTSPNDFMAQAEVVIVVRGAEIVWQSQPN